MRGRVKPRRERPDELSLAAVIKNSKCLAVWDSIRIFPQTQNKTEFILLVILYLPLVIIFHCTGGYRKDVR